MSDEVKSVLVRDWYIQIYPEGMLVILGTKLGDGDGVVWRSSPIVKRVSSRVVETFMGSRYVLQGDINRSMTRLDPKAYPVDDELLKAFAHGFPAKWQRQVKQFCSRKAAEERSAEEKELSELNSGSMGEATESENSGKASSKARSGKISSVQTKGRRLKRSPMAARSSKSTQRSAARLASSSSGGDSSGQVSISVTAEDTSEPNSAAERISTPVNVDVLEPNTITSTTMINTTSGSDSSRQVYRLRSRSRALKTVNDSGEMITGDSTDSSGKEAGGSSESQGASASARTRGILKHRNRGNQASGSAVASSVEEGPGAESGNVLDSSAYFADVLSNLKFLSPKVDLVVDQDKKAVAKGKKKKKSLVQQKQKEKKAGAIAVAEGSETPSIKGKQNKRSKRDHVKKPKILLQREAELNPVKKIKRKSGTISREVTRNKVSSANQLLQNLRVGQLAKESDAEGNSESSSNPTATLVLAKPGTLKRSRQIQEAMKERDAGYSADAFDEATPLKKKTKVQFQDLADVSEEEEDYDSESMEENISESGMESPVTTWRERLGAPLPTTPDLSVYDYDEPTTIKSADRKAAAQISYRIRKKTLRVKTTKTDIQGQRLKGKGKKLNSAVFKNLQAATRKMDTLMDADSENSFEDSDFSESSSECEDVLNSLY